ncbi:MAG: three-Cys-motif partner protein TcmP [Lacunisphaera sp.]|nr:three-Cys-motif partner protein TcmP [Lacunisphaera sp.]
MPEEQCHLFDPSSIPIGEKKLELKTAEAPVWTENKAQLIQRYLRYFVFITKHGTYLDAFSAPQSPDHADVSCAAKLVLESDPKWFRNFALFDLSKPGIAFLQNLATANTVTKRTIHVIQGDSNVELPAFLAKNPIPEKEATFCLLDQRTFECDWQTVVEVAKHKKTGNKIEVFYFLAQGWLDRSIAALGNPEVDLLKWWGNDDWKVLAKMPGSERGIYLAERFKKEFGYRYAYAFAIYQRDGIDAGKVMFWMIHASDHEEAPKLMMRAYRNVVAPLEPIEQLKMEFGADAASTTANGSVATANPQR